jgi:hypothetical protein
MSAKDVVGSIGKALWDWLPSFKKGGKITKKQFVKQMKMKAGGKVRKMKK